VRLSAVLALLMAGGCRAGGPRSTASAPATDAHLAAADAAPPPPPPRGQDLALLYSSNLQGHATPCDCVRPLGGLARRATLVAQARRQADGVLVVDAGDLLDGDRDARRARAFTAAVRAGGLDAFTPGERDLALGVPFLQKLGAAQRLPILASNLTDAAGKRLFGGERVVQVGGAPVGIFGISAPPTPADADRWRAAGIAVRPPDTAAREAIAALRHAGAQVVIGLFHVGPPAEARRLIAGLSGLDWAVLGHSALNLETPEQAGGARLLEAFAEGKNLGRLDLHVVGGRFDFADAGQRAELEAILADHRRQLGGYAWTEPGSAGRSPSREGAGTLSGSPRWIDRSLGGMDPAALESYYRQRRTQLEAAIARETEALARLPRAITGSWFENVILPLDATIPDDPVVEGLVRRLDPHL
jgi:2',3'-cyclic-nucleotide 2'-phosphodiesterase (5'-nucleotidase family)